MWIKSSCCVHTFAVVIEFQQAWAVSAATAIGGYGRALVAVATIGARPYSLFFLTKLIYQHSFWLTVVCKLMERGYVIVK